jgi:ABC-type lipoprotein release transport system permease subunit
MTFARTRVAIFLAVRSLVRGNAGVTSMAITMMAAIFVSVMFLPSLLGGASTRLNTQVVDTLTGDLTILPEGTTSIRSAAAYVDQVRKVDGVDAVTAIRRVGNQVSHDGTTMAQGVDAIDPVSHAQVFSTHDHLIEGEWLRPGDVEGILLGVGVAGADRTELRTYSGSLRTVHVGDRVEVGVIGGGTESFVVRGIYQNDFPLSDLGALVTTDAAAQLTSDVDVADQIRDTFAALDRLSRALSRAGDQADTLAEATAGLLGGADQLARSSENVARSAAKVDGGSTQLAANARSLAASAEQMAGGADQLATGLRSLADDVATPAVRVAGSAAATTEDVAADAASLARTCPPTDPSFCATVAQHAQVAGEAAGLSAASLEATTGLSSGVMDAAESAEALAARLRVLASAADGLADAATSLRSGAAGVATGADGLADAAGRLTRQSSKVAAAAEQLGDRLDDGADVTTPDRASRDDLLATLDSVLEPPGPHSATRIVLRTSADTATTDVEQALAPLRTDVSFQDPSQLATAIQDQLDTFALINNIMRVMSLVVAAITVLIITYIDLTNRRRQIGIERAIGIRSSAIVGSYVIKSMVTALVGTALGWLVFRLVLVPAVDRRPFHFPNGDVTLAAVRETAQDNVTILLVVAAVAAALPAIRTVRMRILDAIWGS